MKNINILKDLKTLNKLHASSVESYTTNNGIVDFTCENAGYVDNVVIEGETLVNLVNLSTVNELEELFYVYNEPYLMFSNKTYTIVNNFNKDVYFEIKDFAGVFLRSYLVPPNSSDKISLSENECILSIAFKKVDGWTFELVEDNKNRGAVILEGNHTDKPISYFEGLKSVGQGDKIEVLAREHNKTNLLKSQNVTYKDNYMISYASGLESASNNHKYTETYIEIEPNTDYCFYHTSRNICWYDENKNFIFQPLNERILGENVNKDLFFSAKSPSNAKYLRVTIIKGIHNNGKTSEIYKGKYDHKQIPTTLRSLPNGVKDTIEKRGNKYVKVQRCGEVTLNGNEQIGMYVSNGNTGVFGVVHKGHTQKRSLGICDKFRYHMVYNTREEHFYLETGNAVNIEISLSKLSSSNEEGLKTWLQSNPVTIVYELATPIITELPNFNPQTYKGENTLIINSGAIQCDASFDVCEGIRSELDVIKDKVSSLDDDYIVDIPIQYLNGWEGSLICRVNGKCVTLTGMLHGQGVAIQSARTHILKLPINSKAINNTAIGLYNAFGQYVGAVESTVDNEIRISHSDFTYNGNYIGLNLSWFLH